MKKMIALAVVTAMIALCAPAHAAKHWDDMSWWGNTGATKAPVADSQKRKGFWWWPTKAASNKDDGELWGNRGIVYHVYAKKADAPKVVDQKPREVPGPAVVKHDAINAKVLFDFDKAIVKPAGKLEVDKIVGELKKHGKDTCEVSGHTCDIGTDQYNMGLGQRRADAVKKYMVESGIDAGRISTKSYGESKPAVPNNSAANRALNRRAEFTTVPVDEPAK